MTSMPDFAYRLMRIASDADCVASELAGTGTSAGPAKLPGRGPSCPGQAMSKQRLEAFSDRVIVVLIAIMPWRFR